MTPASDQCAAQSRKNLRAILQGLASIGQGTVAAALSVHESTISRMKEPQKDGRKSQLEELAILLATCGLKAVPAAFRCYEPRTIEAILILAREKLNRLGSVTELEWEPE